MANEASVTVSLAFAKALIGTQTLASGAISRDVSGTAYIRNVQAVGTAKEALLIGDVAPGLCLMHNADATNFVTILPNNTDPGTIKLLAGDWALFRFSQAAPFAQADTGAINLEYFLIAA